MDELIPAFEEIASKLAEILVTLNEISSKLDNISGIYGIDDVVAKLDTVTDEITGPTGYNLTSIFKAVSDLNAKT